MWECNKKDERASKGENITVWEGDRRGRRRRRRRRRRLCSLGKIK
jgi:hypothetical protein